MKPHEQLCRCGETHTGTYRIEDWLHCNCFHKTKLWDMGHDQVMCPDCGLTWLIEREGSVTNPLNIGQWIHVKTFEDKVELYFVHEMTTGKSYKRAFEIDPPREDEIIIRLVKGSFKDLVEGEYNE